MMKRIIVVILISLQSSLTAQEFPPVIKNPLTTSGKLKLNSRRGTLIQKQIFSFGKFKYLNFQKIVSKDMTDDFTENVLGIMTEYETYDNVSKRTLTIEKPELNKLIQSLQALEEKENQKTNTETKYKFLTLSDIEFGAIYNEEKKIWTNYIKFPSMMYNQNSLNEYNKDELKELIKLLVKIEIEL